MKFIYVGLLALSLAFTGLAHSANTIKDNATDATFPSEISVENSGKTFKLQATGVATRKKLIVKVYSIAHYIEDAASFSKTNFFQEVLKDGKAKQFTMKWVRNVPAEKVLEAYHESFNKVLAGKESPQVKESIEKFLTFFNQEAKTGDEYILRWLPGGVIEVNLNGKSAGSVTNNDFAAALWSIWFGENSIVNRDQLISQLR